MAAGRPETTPRPGGRAGLVLLNWNSWEDTRDRAIAARSWRRLRPRVVVVDNGSSGPDEARLRAALPDVDLVAAGRNLGFGGGSNLALRRLTTPYALLLNPDAVVDEPDVEALLAALDEDPLAAVAGPVLTDGTGCVRAVGGRDIGRYARTHWRPHEAGRRVDSVHEVDYVPGTVALLRLEAFHGVGGFDERFFFSGEMADLCRRLRVGGWRCLVVPRARARHERGGRSPERRDLDAYYALRNRFLYVAKHANTGSRWLWALRGTASAVRHLALARPSRARAELRAVAHGLRGRFGAAHGEAPL